MLWGLTLLLAWQTCGVCQEKKKEKPYEGPDAATMQKLAAEGKELQKSVDALRGKVQPAHRWADVAIYPKGVEWILRHKEFYKPEFVRFTEEALKRGKERLAQLEQGKAPWEEAEKRTIHGYISRVDGSVQPYAISIPAALRSKPDAKWPLHIILHGRNATLNEVGFLHSNEGKPLEPGQAWAEVEIYGRTNNAYRWSGETDVLEVLEDVKSRYPIDAQRVVLRGFSMGGAGSWHLGLHYPSLWCAVGPGAGFVDFYEYQKITTPLPKTQDETLRIYDTVHYALNAADVPVCTYGGELDAQLLASKRMEAEAKKLNVEIKVLIGPGVGHKFEPNTFKEYMAFHLKNMEAGRPAAPGLHKIRFATRTLKYNHCDWVTVEEVMEPYGETVVEGTLGENASATITTKNVVALRIASQVGADLEIDGTRLKLNPGPNKGIGSLLVREGKKWTVLSEAQQKEFEENPKFHKRHNLQGPIDDAFMESFVCVKGTGKPWEKKHAGWVDWTRKRFEHEFNKGFRGEVRTVDDAQVTDELELNHNLILFGDPGSNAYLAKIVNQLPVTWKKDRLTVDGKDYDLKSHGVALIYPNPRNRSKYVVINSGHTFHAKDLASSNAWLFPRLGDIAVLKYSPDKKEGYTEEIAWSANFDSAWKLPTASRD
ncbi:MAG: prolyl oligopeptidase family serine peptidase [Planctomycetales bacterium]